MAQHDTSTRRQETVTKQTHTPPDGTGFKPEGKQPRRIRLGTYKSFRLQRKSLAPAYEDRGVPRGLPLLRRSIRLLWKHKRLFLGITAVFGLLNLLLAGGIYSTESFQSASDSLGTQMGEEDTADAATGLTLVGLLVSSGGVEGGGPAATALQGILIVLASMALVWALRQVMAGKKPTVRAAWYGGTAAFVPFMLVLLVLILQLAPFVLGGWILTTLIGGEIAVAFLEVSMTMMIFLLMATISVYWLSASVFALYIVTLGGTTPIAALRSASELVRYRRSLVVRRLGMLLLLYVIVSTFLIGPVALTYAPAAPPFFYLMAVLALPLTHAYVYHLYRELLG